MPGTTGADASGDRTTNVDIATALAQSGVPIFPVGPDKRPLTPRGFHDARPDALPWQRRPSALIGIPTAEFWVLDLDPPLAVSVPALCRLLRCDWRDLDAQCGLVVATPRGGLHLYWRRTEGIAIRTAAGDIGQGIDTRGHTSEGRATGFIVAPGCTLPDGRRYRIEHGALSELVEAPRRLLWLASLSRRERARIAADPELTATMRAAEPSACRGLLDTHARTERARLPANGPDATGPMRRQAMHDLDAEREHLSGLSDGRRTAVFRAAARLARYVAHGVLRPDEVEGGLLAAWQASGAERRYGRAHARGAVRRALDTGRNDPLPPLARRFRNRPGSTTP